jgi:AcrR family transcriptional regulator
MSREQSAAEPGTALEPGTTEVGTAEPQERSSPIASSPIAGRQFSLRERKFARTKLALLQAALERMRGKKLDEIPVKELCDEVEVSEATFFNYFPKKSDLLHYLIKVWTIEVAWQAKTTVGEECGLSFIEQVFDYTGKKLAEHPRLMLEIIAHMALEPHPSACPKTNPELSLAEKLQAFPECAGVECVPELALPEVFRGPLERAVARGELPAKADIEAAVLALLGIFFGVPLWLGPHDSEKIRPAYHRQLKLLWAGLRCR